MPQKRRTIPLAAMEKILKAAGASRVSEESKEALANLLEKYGGEVAKSALKFAFHAGRKTVKAEDISLASTKSN